jgi:hypothetical protein
MEARPVESDIERCVYHGVGDIHMRGAFVFPFHNFADEHHAKRISFRYRHRVDWEVDRSLYSVSQPGGHAGGVFVPIEVTLNRIWKAPENMSFVKNQIISFAVVLLCGTLSLFSFLIGGISLWIIKVTLGHLPFPRAEIFADLVSVKVLGFLLSMTLFLLVFRFLPNIRMPMETLIRASIFTGVIWELGKYAFIWALGKLDLGAIYGAYFTAAVVLILWSYVSAMMMIIGAELAHRELLSLRLFRPAFEEWKLLHADRSRPG